VDLLPGAAQSEHMLHRLPEPRNVGKGFVTIRCRLMRPKRLDNSRRLHYLENQPTY
jgi:hypothetical protein